MLNNLKVTCASTYVNNKIHRCEFFMQQHMFISTFYVFDIEYVFQSLCIFFYELKFLLNKYIYKQYGVKNNIKYSDNIFN